MNNAYDVINEESQELEQVQIEEEEKETKDENNDNITEYQSMFSALFERKNNK